MTIYLREYNPHTMIIFNIVSIAKCPSIPKICQYAIFFKHPKYIHYNPHVTF